MNKTRREAIEKAVVESEGVWNSMYQFDGITQTEFDQVKFDMQNKPSWADAPNIDGLVLVQDEDGLWKFASSGAKLSKSKIDGKGFWNALYCYPRDYGKVIGDWRNTLEQRPDTVDQESNMQDNSNWHELGEFPPAGTRCEVLFCGQWYETIIVGMSSFGSCVYECDGLPCKYLYDSNSEPSVFRPIRTERDKLVDKLTGFNVGGWVITEHSAKDIAALLMED